MAKKMLEEFPRPWRVVQNEKVDPEIYGGGFEVLDANGRTLIYSGTCSGEDENILNRLQIAELVAMVNSIASVPELPVKPWIERFGIDTMNTAGAMQDEITELRALCQAQAARIKELEAVCKTE